MNTGSLKTHALSRGSRLAVTRGGGIEYERGPDPGWSGDWGKGAVRTNAIRSGVPERFHLGQTSKNQSHVLNFASTCQ